MRAENSHNSPGLSIQKCSDDGQPCNEVRGPAEPSGAKSTARAELTPGQLRSILERHVSPAWPLELLLRLCAEWWAGTICSAIGERLGVSRNAVSGKVWRLCELHILDHRPNPSIALPDVTDAMRRRRDANRAREVRRLAKGDDLRAYKRSAFTSRVVELEATPPPVPKRLTPAALNRPLRTAPKPRQVHASSGMAEIPRVPRYTPPVERHGRIVECSWPIGEPGTRDFRFCDEPSERGCSYCEDHNRIGHIRARGHADPLAGTGALLAGSAPP